MNTRELSMTAIVAALYAALVIVFAPISFGPIQLRIADCLIPISALLGFPAVAGVGLGALIGNMYWFLSPIDVIFGSIANLIAGFIILKFRKRLFLACITASLIIGTIVGGYLWLFFPPPSILGVNLPIWFAMIVSITLSSLIAIAGFGYLLIQTLKSTSLKNFSA